MAQASGFSRGVTDESVTPSSGGTLGLSELIVISEIYAFWREIPLPSSENGAKAQRVELEKELVTT